MRRQSWQQPPNPRANREGNNLGGRRTKRARLHWRVEEKFSHTLWPTSASATSVVFFLKMIGGIGPKAIQTATQNVAVAMNVVRNGMCAGHEPLEAILARTPMTEAYKHPKPSSRTVSWRDRRHPAFQAQQGPTDAEIAPRQAEFCEATHILMLPREQEAIWLELCKQSKNGRIS